MREFYGGFRNAKPPPATRRLCLSRRSFEQATRGVWRVFENRTVLEQMAVARGFEVVAPEELSFADQIRLFQSAACIVGEHGSGMHAAVFAEAGTLVATGPMWNSVQLGIGAAFGHRNVAVTRAAVRREASGPMRYSVPEEDLAGMFVMLDLLQPLGLAF
jgi:capsular polysaccharide biosynthesis protein